MKRQSVRRPLGHAGGFTLIELLTVLAIITLVLAMSVSALSGGGQALKNAAATVKAQIALGRQRAISERCTFRLAFVKESGSAGGDNVAGTSDDSLADWSSGDTAYRKMVLFKVPSKGTPGSDEPAPNGTQVLDQRVYFSKCPGATAGSDYGKGFIFRPDGTVDFNGSSDISSAAFDSNPESNHDVGLELHDGSKKIYLDVTALTARARGSKVY